MFKAPSPPVTMSWSSPLESLIGIPHDDLMNNYFGGRTTVRGVSDGLGAGWDAGCSASLAGCTVTGGVGSLI